MTDPPSPLDVVRPLLRVRQIRSFTDEPVEPAELDALADVARWSGSGQNQQPWRFILIRQAATLRTIADAGMPQTRSLQTATAAIAISLPEEPGRAISNAFDEGRAAERIFIAASMLDLAAGIAWIRADARAAVRDLLALPADRFVRTMVAIGHPSIPSRRAKSPRGQARLPREVTVFGESWPAD